MQLAGASNEIVPAEMAETEPAPEELKSVPLVAVTPSQKEEPLTEAILTTPVPEKLHRWSRRQKSARHGQPSPTCWVGWSDCSRGGIWSETTRKTQTVRGMHLAPWHAPVKTHAAVRRSS